MKKYINAEVFKAKIMNYGRIYEGDRIPIPFYKEHCGKMFTELLRWVCEEVDDALPADVAEVVRCKDCKYQNKGQNECDSWNMCEYRSWLYFPVNDEDFCSNGERKNG